MQQETVRSILRIIAVTTVMVGIVLILQSFISLVMMGSIASGSFGGVSIKGVSVGGNLGFYLFLSQLCVSAVGLVLYKASDLIAGKIVGAVS